MYLAEFFVLPEKHVASVAWRIFLIEKLSFIDLLDNSEAKAEKDVTKDLDEILE